MFLKSCIPVHSWSGCSAVNFRLTRSRATAPAAIQVRCLPRRRRWTLDPRHGHQPGDLLAVPHLAAVADLGNQPVHP
jgi:hypothetical protein